MATWTSITKVGSASWQFTPSGTAPWYEWLNGALVKNATAEISTIYEGTDLQEPPPVELLTSTGTATAQNSLYPPILYLQWRGVTSAYAYYVQQYVSAAWSTYAVVRENGSGYYKIATLAQADNAAVKWRVIIYDSMALSGTAVESDLTMVCNPTVPSISGTYSSGTGLLTIAAR